MDRNVGNYILWVGGTDDHYKTLEGAEIAKLEWEEKGYDDVYIESKQALLLREIRDFLATDPPEHDIEYFWTTEVLPHDKRSINEILEEATIKENLLLIIMEHYSSFSVEELNWVIPSLPNLEHVQLSIQTKERIDKMSDIGTVDAYRKWIKGEDIE